MLLFQMAMPAILDLCLNEKWYHTSFSAEKKQIYLQDGGAGHLLFMLERDIRTRKIVSEMRFSC